MTDKTKGFSFQTNNKNVLSTNITTNKVGRKNKPEKDKIIKKVLLTLTEEEYITFLEKYKASGFPSESSFLKHQIKQINII